MKLEKKRKKDFYIIMKLPFSFQYTFKFSHSCGKGDDHGLETCLFSSMLTIWSFRHLWLFVICCYSWLLTFFHLVTPVSRKSHTLCNTMAEDIMIKKGNQTDRRTSSFRLCLIRLSDWNLYNVLVISFVSFYSFTQFQS